jgi:hypothetical protein
MFLNVFLFITPLKNCMCMNITVLYYTIDKALLKKPRRDQDETKNK